MLKASNGGHESDAFLKILITMVYHHKIKCGTNMN